MAETLINAVGNFLAPIAAEYARIIEEGDPEAQMTIEFHGYRHHTTLGALQDLDRAHQRAHERNEKAAERRRARGAVGTLI
jgi:hypothetical protein